MNKEKISLQEVADLLASKASISKRSAEEFLKIMFSSVEESLLAGEIVKIKNFGTFKVLWNEPRKSVNIQTGEEIILPGYYKVSFIPDILLKETVNEPYAHLQSVELDNENPDLNVEEKTEVPLDPLRVFTEQAAEIKDLISEIQSLSTAKSVVVEKNDENIETQPITQIEVIIESSVEEEPKKAEQIKSIEDIFIKKEPVKEPEIEPISEPVYIPIPPTVDERKPASSTSDFVFNSIPDSGKPMKKNKNKLWIWILGIVIIIGVVKVSLYLFYPPVTKWTDSALISCKATAINFKDKIYAWVTPSHKPVASLETVVVPKDTADNDSINEEKPVDSLQILFDTPRVYPEFIATVRIRRGSRLALISKRYYGKSDFWVYIYEANNLHIPNPDDIPTGTRIRIPKIDPRLIDASNPRCIRKARELHDLYVK